MNFVSKTAHLGDDQFLEAFHSCRLKSDEFRHADHLRLAWIHVHKDQPDAAVANVCNGIRRFAAFHGAKDLYHETTTAAWVRLIATHNESTFEEFLARHQDRLNKDLLHRFWTPELLASDQARQTWVPPDRMRLPGLN